MTQRVIRSYNRPPSSCHRACWLGSRPAGEGRGGRAQGSGCRVLPQSLLAGVHASGGGGGGGGSGFRALGPATLHPPSCGRTGRPPRTKRTRTPVAALAHSHNMVPYTCGRTGPPHNTVPYTCGR